MFDGARVFLVTRGRSCDVKEDVNIYNPRNSGTEMMGRTVPTEVTATNLAVMQV